MRPDMESMRPAEREPSQRVPRSFCRTEGTENTQGTEEQAFAFSPADEPTSGASPDFPGSFPCETGLLEAGAHAAVPPADVTGSQCHVAPMGATGGYEGTTVVVSHLSYHVSTRTWLGTPGLSFTANKGLPRQPAAAATSGPKGQGKGQQGAAGDYKGSGPNSKRQQGAAGDSKRYPQGPPPKHNRLEEGSGTVLCLQALSCTDSSSSEGSRGDLTSSEGSGRATPDPDATPPNNRLGGVAAVGNSGKNTNSSKAGSIGSVNSDSSSNSPARSLAALGMSRREPSGKLLLGETSALRSKQPMRCGDGKPLPRTTGGRADVNEVLHDVSFVARPGEVLAVVGPSGAGKSTLLDAIAGQLPPSRCMGSVLIGGQLARSAACKHMLGHVMQEDALYPMLSPRETLMTSARLRLPLSVGRAGRRERVERILADLGLQKVADSRIGDASQRGISGGERRRVSIGLDLVHDPTVLLLDEPTSGLDSQAALQVLRVLQGMARGGRTVILTIHQPSFRILQQVDRLLLLSLGAVAFWGTLPGLERRLAGLGLPVPRRMNPLEYSMELLQTSCHATLALLREAEADRASEPVSNHWPDSEIGSAPRANSSHHLARAGANPLSARAGATSAPVPPDYVTAQRRQYQDMTSGDSWLVKEKHWLMRGWGWGPEEGATGSKGAELARRSVPRGSTFATPGWHEVAVLFVRNVKVVLRSSEMALGRCLLLALVGLGLGTVYLNCTTGQNQVMNIMGFFIFSLTFLLSSAVEALPLFLQEREMFLREVSRSAYRLSSYQIANVLVFLPFLLVQAAVFSAGCYWLVGLNPSPWAFTFFVGVIWAGLLSANSIVALFAALLPDFMTANSLIQATIGGFFLFSGYFIAKESIPNVWIWMYYISVFKYPLEALLINEFTANPSAVYDGALTGQEVLESLGMSGNSKWTQLAASFGFAAFYRILCYFALLWRSRRKL